MGDVERFVLTEKGMKSQEGGYWMVHHVHEQQFAAAREENEKLREALRFYADENNYCDRVIGSVVANDSGFKANCTLGRGDDNSSIFDGGFIE